MFRLDICVIGIKGLQKNIPVFHVSFDRGAEESGICSNAENRLPVFQLVWTYQQFSHVGRSRQWGDGDQLPAGLVHQASAPFHIRAHEDRPWIA